MKDLPVTSPLREGDIYHSRNKIALARSQEVLLSWLPAKQDADSTAAEEDEEDGDFEAMDEAAGLGTSKANANDIIPDTLCSSRASQDKLLEQLLGKKAAQAKRKSLQDARKNTSVLNHSISKPIPPTKSIKSVPTQSNDEEEEEEEGGRAAAFSSRKKIRDTKRPAYIAGESKADDVLVHDTEPPDPREDAATVVEIVQEQKPDEEEVRPKKRKSSSYLDEVLASKAKKKSKKKKKGEGKGGAA